MIFLEIVKIICYLYIVRYCLVSLWYTGVIIHSCGYKWSEIKEAFRDVRKELKNVR